MTPFFIFPSVGKIVLGQQKENEEEDGMLEEYTTHLYTEK